MLKNRCVLRILQNIIWINIVIGAIYWITDAAIDSFLFNESGLIDSIFFPPAHEIWMRSYLFFFLLLQGFIIQSVIDRWETVLKEKCNAECEKSIEYMEGRHKARNQV